MFSCEHVSLYKERVGMHSYHILSRNFISSLTNSARNRRALDVYCYVCRSKCNRLHACLYCVYIGCFETHIKEHGIMQDHDIFTDLQSGNLFCVKCDDYVYDEDFEMISREIKQEVAIANGVLPYKAWEPSVEEIKGLREHGGIKRIKADSNVGLRGLVNLGNTCYINCIIQVLVHIPILRNYFLSNKHHCDSQETCVACELSNIVQEFFIGSHIPFVPFNVIYLMWKHAKELVGFDQQDAHEYFLQVLDALHKNCAGDVKKTPGESIEGDVKKPDESIESPKNEEPPPKNDVPPPPEEIIDNEPKVEENIVIQSFKDERGGPKLSCKCIIHQIFTGFYESDVTCHNCQAVSPTFEPFWDISLDLEAESKSPEGLNLRLMDCLYKYTHSEALNSVCPKCNSLERTKQLMIKKLPILVCFHLKRLKTSVKNVLSKINSHIEFPEILDMTPFMASTRASKTDLESVENSIPLYPNDNKFYLIAVVNHMGNEKGHYLSYVRQIRNYWYKCDDTVVSKASEEEVMRSTGYMLFYLKQTLEYGPNLHLGGGVN